MYPSEIGTRPVTLRREFRPSSEPPDPPQLRREPTITYSYQHGKMDCFAHAATHLIFHNMYNIRITEEDKQRYIENRCFEHLDTTNDVEANKETLQEQCGESGGIRILLFLYIYKFITDRFGCNYGGTDVSVNYYIKGLNLPVFEKSFLNTTILPVLKKVNKRDFATSIVEFGYFVTLPFKTYLKQYFDDNYYCVLRLSTPGHFVTIIGMGRRGLLGKDSWLGHEFTIPWEQFKPDGTIKIDQSTWQGISNIYFLYKVTNIQLYNPDFKFLSNPSRFPSVSHF
jgi:hypothetical protein